MFHVKHCKSGPPCGVGSCKRGALELKLFIFLFAAIFCLPRKVLYSGGDAAGKWGVLPPRPRRPKPAGSLDTGGCFPPRRPKPCRRLLPGRRLGGDRPETDAMRTLWQPLVVKISGNLNRSRRPGSAEKARHPPDGGLWLRRRPNRRGPMQPEKRRTSCDVRLACQIWTLNSDVG